MPSARTVIGTTLKVVGFLILWELVALGIPWMYLSFATRDSVIPGEYHASNSWGESMLTLRADHTFTQEVRFSEYDTPAQWPYDEHPAIHHPAARRIVAGHWREFGRDPNAALWNHFDQRIQLEKYIQLGEGNENHPEWENFECSLGPVQLSGVGIEVDAGADIVYRK